MCSLCDVDLVADAADAAVPLFWSKRRSIVCLSFGRGCLPGLFRSVISACLRGWGEEVAVSGAIDWPLMSAAAGAAAGAAGGHWASIKKIASMSWDDFLLLLFLLLLYEK
jgi:hypothetical protein